jgi:hypothetical protein
MRNQRTDSGSYNRPAQIQARAAYADDGQGGNANANSWTTVRSPMIHLQSGNFGRGTKRSYQFGQLYPTASHWAEMRYSHDQDIDATMTLLVDNRRFQILGAIDVELEHVTTMLALVEYKAQGAI